MQRTAGISWSDLKSRKALNQNHPAVTAVTAGLSCNHQGAPKFGDRKSHQMDPGNVREALREVAIDVDEGADILMVKPALHYLDVIQRVRESFPEIPLAAYNVSGEYAMVKAAAANGWLDERNVTLETLTAIKRAGADMIITYHAKDAAQWLKV